MNTSRENFPKSKFPFSDALCKFMDDHPEFLNSLKLSNLNQFEFIPLIFISHTPSIHAKHKDEVIGMWYLDKSGQRCKFHNRICLFKQDFVANVNKQDKEYVSYSTSNNNGKYVRSIAEFFSIYGANGKFYHDGREWQHHYVDVNALPDEPRLREMAKSLKRKYLATI